MTWSTCDTSPNVCSIYTFGSSNLVYTVWFINTFCYFINSNVGEFHYFILINYKMLIIYVDSL